MTGTSAGAPLRPRPETFDGCGFSSIGAGRPIWSRGRPGTGRSSRPRVVSVAPGVPVIATPAGPLESHRTLARIVHQRCDAGRMG